MFVTDPFLTPLSGSRNLDKGALGHAMAFPRRPAAKAPFPSSTRSATDPHLVAEAGHTAAAKRRAVLSRQTSVRDLL